MGLDLVPEGCAKPGHEAEWRLLLERSFGDQDVDDAEKARFVEISIPPYERVGAPRVGYDKAADEWIIEASNASAEQIPEMLKDMHGYYVLRLVKCDGIPEYSHGGLYDGVDDTSFRGSFLGECGDVLPKSLIDEAWSHKFPEEAIRYGRALLAAAGEAAAAGAPAKQAEPKPGFFSRLAGAAKKPDSAPFDEQLKIVQAAGKWLVFWGERGHAIRAWF